MTEAVERVELGDPRHAAALVGEREAHLKELAHVIRDVSVSCRGNVVLVRGDPDAVGLAAAVLEQLYELVKEGYPLYRADIDHAVRVLRANRRARLKDIFLDAVYIAADRRVISPKSLAQKEYIEAIRSHDIVFGIGPAGTGKTYLAMAMAIAAHAKRLVKRIILTRPAVEAGERLGFLPGTLYEKVNPYLRPLYDALHDMMDFDRAAQLIERGIIEVAPLAFMRGRTLNDSFVILDEAQNTTSEQMRMFLTRLGFDSKAVITGDVTQVDLPPGTVSGLVEAETLLSGIPGIRFCRFTRDDVVRHPLVQEIIEAYEARDRARQAESPR
ncbi:MAG: PhoH family protein [Candidatus Dadabacteria bacterium]|nr:MAG: PhoH family protein [Candidatus Dadabacteria bacterium]